MPTKQININITNTQSFTTQISLFGGLQDPNKYSVNAYTLYTWDTSLVNFSANATFNIQAKRSGALSFNTIVGNMNIYASSDYYVFGDLTFPV